MNTRNFWAWLTLAAVFSAIPGVSAIAFAQTAVALRGDTAPGTGGGTYWHFYSPSISASGDVVFAARVLSGGNISQDEGIFVDSGGTDRAVALVGDTAPGAGGGTYTGVSLCTISASGDVVFVAGVTGGTTSEGIFVDSGGTDRAVALIGDAAPGTGGGTYSKFEGYSINRASINASGDVAFVAEVTTGGTVSKGIFVDSGGTDTAVALIGDTAPGTGGRAYLWFNGASINDSGDVAFIADLPDFSPFDLTGIFVDSGGSDAVVALSTDTAPGTGGGTYWNFYLFSINASGDVAFLANLAQGIFVDSGGTDTAVALIGDAAPGTGGGTYGGSWSFVKPINDSGDVVFPAEVTGGTVSGGIFVDSGGTDTAVALVGDTAPGTGGGTYWSVDSPSINDAGDVVFSARVTGGTVSEGIFLPEPSLWLMLTAGACFLAVLYLLRDRRIAQSTFGGT